VFVVFFAVLYGTLTYGFIFMAQQSLNLAAEDAVRTALRWQQGGGAMAARADAALAVANDRTSWVGAMGSAAPAVAVCGRAGALGSSGAGTCSGRALADDQLEVVVRYAYGAHPLIPTLPGMGVAVPQTLFAWATARLGGGMTTLEPGG
jgi:hypothetical protein